MNRSDDSKFLLFIEPNKNQKSKEPINDKLTELMKRALEKATTGTSNYSNTDQEAQFRPKSMYKGLHRTMCGEYSDNKDYLLENGMITNSLAVFYLQYYRSAIPKTELKKLSDLEKFYGKSENT